MSVVNCRCSGSGCFRRKSRLLIPLLPSIAASFHMFLLVLIFIDVAFSVAACTRILGGMLATLLPLLLPFVVMLVWVMRFGTLRLSG